MIDDFRGPGSAARRKPTVIDPPKPTGAPLPDFETAAAEYDEAESVKAAIRGDEVAPAKPNFTFNASDTLPTPPPEQSWESPLPEPGAPDEPPKPPAGKSNPFMKWRWTLSKKWTIVLIAGIVLLLAAGAAAVIITHPGDMGGQIKSIQPKYNPPITTVPSNLTGLQVDPAVNQRPVTGVMIENSTDARPQSGLDQAGVVFEAIAEGGITRFLALFQDTAPGYIGPVRSVRPYYLQWCMGYDCAIAHVGGSPEALKDIKSWGVKDLDQFYNSGAYHRISSRYAPHNMYTSISKLNQLEQSKGFGAPTYTAVARKKDNASTTPNATSIDFAISGPQYNAHFDYDAATNSYARSEGGKPHNTVNEAGAQTQIKPKVVVALVMQYGLEADDHHSKYNVIGSGQAFVFQDGTVTAATWSKPDSKSPITLTGSDNKPVALNAGQTWFTALSAANLAKYK